MLHRIGKPRRGRWLALTASLLLLTSAPAFAQTAAPLSGPALSTREGNVFDHRDHQPTAADDAAAGVAPGRGEDVEKEIQDLLQQTDNLDRQSDQQNEALPALSPRPR
ncbi:MAG TPA: hypothetical protein VLX85_03960 [Stellaceae bacterium]|nr:hypothetical protein [Stellaceae bacterium]